MAWHLKIEEEREARIERGLEIAIIIAALATLPLTAAYWFEWNGLWVTIGDWAIWVVFVIEYAFFMLVSPNRWQTTKERWISIAIIIFSFPMLHEILRTTRLIRLARFVPVLRTSRVLRQIHFLRLSNVRSAGSQVGWEKAQRHLDDDNPIIRAGNWFGDVKNRAIDRVTPEGALSDGEGDDVDERDR
jgi:hypothetical protein